MHLAIAVYADIGMRSLLAATSMEQLTKKSDV